MIATALVVWANFLPLPGYNEAAPRAHLHVLSLQLSIIYIMNAAYKNGYMWTDGSAVLHALNSAYARDNTLVKFMNTFPLLPYIATEGTLWIEGYGWILFWIPSRPAISRAE